MKTNFACRVGSLSGKLQSKSAQIASTWLQLTGKKRSREFSHSLGRLRSVAKLEVGAGFEPSTQTDDRGLSARVRRSCQVRVRAVCGLRAGATRLILYVRSCRLFTRVVQEMWVSLCCEAPLSGEYLARTWLAPAHSSHSRHFRRATSCSMFGRFECVTGAIAARNPLS